MSNNPIYPPIPIMTMGSMSNEYTQFKSYMNSFPAKFTDLIALGTVLYGDANFAAAYPIDWPAYQTWLISIQTAINTFLQNFPAEPPLSE